MTHVTLVRKSKLVFFFPFPSVKALKESGLSEQKLSAQHKALSERKQMSFHPFSGGKMSGTITGATYGTDKTILILALHVRATRLGDVFCKIFCLSLTEGSVMFWHKFENQSQITLLYSYRKYKKFAILMGLAGVICVKQRDILIKGIEKSLTVTEYSIIFKKQGRFIV